MGIITSLPEGRPEETPASAFTKYPHQGLEDNHSQYSGTSSQRSTKQRQLKLKLQILEEQRQLQEKEEATKREYLRKRHELMTEIANEEESVIDMEQELPEARVSNWLQGKDPGPVTGAQNHQHFLVRPEQSSTIRENTNQQFRTSVEGLPRTHRQGETRLNRSAPRSSIQQVTSAFGQMQMGNNDQQSAVNQGPHSSIGMAPPQISTSISTPRLMDFDGEDEVFLSRSHIAARQAVSRDLPTFNGTPEEWPLFYSTFTTTTRMCGYTQEENLIRLQKCLKGKAHEAVKCRLMHPSNVPGIMSTLKMLYGNPEVIVQNLIAKIQSTPQPKAEKLDTIIEFSLAIQNLCATIEACKLDEYSYNIALLNEFVNKLPCGFKVEWAKHRRNLPRANIREFAYWLNELAETVCPIASLQSSGVKNAQGNKNSAYLHAHSEDTFEDSTENPSKSFKYTRSDQTLECVACKSSCPTLEKCQRFVELGYNSKWDVVKEFGLCRKCLRKHKGPCRSQQVCGKNGCAYKHHQLLHNYQRDQTNATNSKEEDSKAVVQNSSGECNMHRQHKSTVLFRVLPITLHAQNKSIKTYAFLDDGSSLTLIDASLAQELNLTGRSEPLCLKWTGNNSRREDDSKNINVEISGTGKASKTYTAVAHTVASLNLFRQTIDAQKLKAQYSHLQGIPLESYRNIQPKILIASDNANLIFQLKGREGKFQEPIATKTRLGWSVYGGTTGVDALVGHHSVQICPCNTQSDEILQQAICKYFSFDALGIYKPEKVLESQENQRAREILQSITQTTSGRSKSAVEIRLYTSTE